VTTDGLRGIKTIEELDLTSKRVFIRLDLNVPMKNGIITDDTRIRAALPTVKYAISKKAKIILASHLGRPKGDTQEDRAKFSLAAVGQRLSELLDLDIILFEDPNGEGIKALLTGLNDKQLILLENTRFAPGEEKNSIDMAANLASFTEVYIDDAFGAIHRAHATVAALPSLVKVKGIGFLIQKEVTWLDKLLHAKEKPFLTILGGAKVSDKIGVIENLMERVDSFVIGGAMAYTFLAAQDIPVGKSLVEKDKLHIAQDLLKRFKNRDKKLILPVDHVIASQLRAGVETKVTPTAAIPQDMMGLDIGPKTIDLVKAEVARAKIIFWNGPMGAFETEPFEKGTFAVAKALAESKVTTVVGGGDSVTAVEEAGFANQMSHISTGGGASLEYLEGRKLPGLEVLRETDFREGLIATTEDEL
jgi:phosphoglycerate kinase